MAQIIRANLAFFLAIFFGLVPSIAHCDEELVCSTPKSLTCPMIQKAHANIPSTVEAWMNMIGGAKTNIDVDMSYIANPEGHRSPNTRKLLDLIEMKAKSGVNVRVFLDGNVMRKPGYNDLHTFPSGENISIVKTPLSEVFNMNHKKMIVVDRGSQAYVGSANFDANLLEGNVGDCGIVFNGPAAKEAFLTFEKYYDRYNQPGLESPGDKDKTPRESLTTSIEEESTPKITQSSPRLVCSHYKEIPKDKKQGNTAYELINMIQSAQSSIRIQMFLLFSKDLFPAKKNHPDRNFIETIYREIDRKCSENLDIQILLDGSQFLSGGQFHTEEKKKMFIDDLKEHLPSCTSKEKNKFKLKIVHVPMSNDQIGYAPQIHSKYMIVDNQTAWLGSENWKDPYFNGGSNCGVITNSQKILSQLSEVFNSYSSCPETTAVILEDPSEIILSRFNCCVTCHQATILSSESLKNISDLKEAVNHVPNR